MFAMESLNKRAFQSSYNEELQLRQHARDLVEAIITCDPNHPFLLKRLAPEFQGTHDRSITPMNKDEFLSLIGHLTCSHHPHSRMEITDEWVDLEGENVEVPHAIAGQFLGVSRYREGLARKGMRMSKLVVLLLCSI